MKRLLRLPNTPEEDSFNNIKFNSLEEDKDKDKLDIFIKPLKEDNGNGNGNGNSNGNDNGETKEKMPKTKAKSKTKTKTKTKTKAKSKAKSKTKATAKSKPKAKSKTKATATTTVKPMPTLKPKSKTTLNDWYLMDKPMGNPFVRADPMHSSPAQGFLYQTPKAYDHMGVLYNTIKPVIEGDDQNFNSYGDVRYDNLIAPIYRQIDGGYEEGNRFNLLYDPKKPFYMKSYAKDFMKGGGYDKNFRFEDNNVPMKVGSQGVIEGDYVLK